MKAHADIDELTSLFGRYPDSRNRVDARFRRWSRSAILPHLVEELDAFPKETRTVNVRIDDRAYLCEESVQVVRVEERRASGIRHHTRSATV